MHVDVVHGQRQKVEPSSVQLQRQQQQQQQRRPQLQTSPKAQTSKLISVHVIVFFCFV